jgi:DNA polymerase III epsilon subunit-like protein
MAKYNNNFVVVDCETGGLPSREKKPATTGVALTEIAAVVINNENLEIISEHNWLVKPHYLPDLIYNPEAEKVSGISLELLENKGIPIEDVQKEFSKVLCNSKLKSKKPQLVGQNILDFDLPFFDNLYKMHKQDLYKDIDKKIWDTLEISRLKFVELTNFKLGTIADACDLDLVQAHRALPDTIATAKIWIEFLKCLRGQGVGKVEEVRFRETFQF